MGLVGSGLEANHWEVKLAVTVDSIFANSADVVLLVDWSYLLRGKQLYLAKAERETKHVPFSPFLQALDALHATCLLVDGYG